MESFLFGDFFSILLLLAVRFSFLVSVQSALLKQCSQTKNNAQTYNQKNRA